MQGPAPYPATDAAEQDAVNVFKRLINTTYVKDDIKTRDKHPNVDGTIELVDENRVPVGKFDIQIRKIPARAVKYSCPTSLFEYSKVSTLPLVLVCVDVDQKKAYWKSIHSTMPEFKPGQDSFTIYFDPALDAIHGSENYLRGWYSLVDEYKKRISEYPILRKEIADRLTVENVSPQDRLFFQEYLDRINHLLDNDFISIKQMWLPGVWKLGAGIYTATADAVSYQLYSIPYGSPAPLICKIEENPFDLESVGPQTLSGHWSTRACLDHPQKAGEAFVFQRVRSAAQTQEFSVHGVRTCTHLLFSFLDKHAHHLGLCPGGSEYALADVSQRLFQYLAQLGAKTARDVRPETGGKRVLVSLGFPPRAVDESIRFLNANQISLIRRPLKPRTLPPSAGFHWIWHGYTQEEEKHNVMSILDGSLDEYSAFVQGNRLVLKESMYLDRDTTVVLVYHPPREGSDQPWPVLQEYLVENEQRRLPKLITVFADKEESHIVCDPRGALGIYGETCVLKLYSEGIAYFLFGRAPFLDVTYRMLRRDLKQHYGITI
jgi:hypothetical protein